jgi:adenosylmethionine---8-amino-7-oxononanoate aminotransferase
VGICLGRWLSVIDRFFRMSLEIYYLRWHRQHLTELANTYPQLTKLQVMGTIAAIDINNQERTGYLNHVGRKIGHQAISRGVLLRPLGNVIYLMPPYCITEAELAWVYQQLDRVLEQVLDRA